MDILSDAQHEAMTFVAACNQNYYNPTGVEVELWRKNRTPADATYKTVHRKVPDSTPRITDLFGLQTADNRMLASLFGDQIRPIQQMLTGISSATGTRYGTREALVKPAETMIKHLVLLRWVAEIPAPDDGERGLRLTELGRALLRSTETEDVSKDDVSVVVLGREDPLAYPILVGQPAAAGTGLLVDPYLKLADLHTISVSTQLTRLLVSGKTNNCGEALSVRVS